VHDMRTWRSKLASQRQQTAWLAGANVEIWTRALTSYRSRMWAWIARTLGRPRCRPLGEPRTGGHWWLLSSPLVAVVVAIGSLVGVYALGRSADPAPRAVPVEPAGGQCSSNGSADRHHHARTRPATQAR